MHFLAMNATKVSLHHTHKQAASGSLQGWANKRYSKKKKSSQRYEKQLELGITHSEYSVFPIQVWQAIYVYYII